MPREVKTRLLARADGDQPGWEVEMEIRLYRERPSGSRPGKPVVARLWDYLVAQVDAGKAGVGPVGVRKRRK